MASRPTARREHIPKAQAKRYRAGQVPENYVDDLSDSSEEEDEEEQQQLHQHRPSNEPSKSLQFAQKEVVTGLKQVEISEAEAASDRRLRRLRQAQQQQQDSVETDDAGRRRRRRQVEEEQEEEEETNEEEKARERLRMKAKALQQQREQEEEMRLRQAAMRMQTQDEGDEDEDEEVHGAPIDGDVGLSLPIHCRARASTRQTAMIARMLCRACQSLSLYQSKNGTTVR